MTLECPDAAYHGKPFRYCVCGWMEEPPAALPVEDKHVTLASPPLDDMDACLTWAVRAADELKADSAVMVKIEIQTVMSSSPGDEAWTKQWRAAVACSWGEPPAVPVS